MSLPNLASLTLTPADSEAPPGTTLAAAHDRVRWSLERLRAGDISTVTAVCTELTDRSRVRVDRRL